MCCRLQHGCRGLGLGISKPKKNKETSTQDKIGSDSNTVEGTISVPKQLPKQSKDMDEVGRSENKDVYLEIDVIFRKSQS